MIAAGDMRRGMVLSWVHDILPHSTWLILDVDSDGEVIFMNVIAIAHGKLKQQTVSLLKLSNYAFDIFQGATILHQ